MDEKKTLEEGAACKKAWKKKKRVAGRACPDTAGAAVLAVFPQLSTPFDQDMRGTDGKLVHTGAPEGFLHWYGKT